MAADLNTQLLAYDRWKHQLISAIEDYQSWLETIGLTSPETDIRLYESLRNLKKNKITIAFAAEFSRGKTELINALFFSSTGVRLLPSSPGRTTMCPTELTYDETQEPYLRLLDIETRLDDKAISKYKDEPKSWTHIELDCSSTQQMQESLKELVKTRWVPEHLARAMGLVNEASQPNENGEIEVPCWRHAIISFPHPLLEKGLNVLDTPGLNALGSEPELTLNMLQEAEAMIFVLAADTGVTQSDMDMWQHHIQNYRHKHPNSLAVVLNKIDTLLDELMTEEEVNASIYKQTDSTARLLELNPQSIFPVSAKQALIGRIKGDEAKLQESRIWALEQFLSERVMGSQCEILQHTILKDINKLMSESSDLVNNRILNTQKQFDELSAIFGKNESTTAELIIQTRNEQTAYMKNIGHLKTSRHVFNTQIDDLLAVLNPQRAQDLIEDGREKMLNSWTTMGIRSGMQSIFKDLHTMLTETIKTTEDSSRLVLTIYEKFRKEHGFTVNNPQLFSIKRFQIELEDVFQEGVEFSNSPAAALMEKGVLAKRFISTIGEKALAIFEDAYQEVKAWRHLALTPLINHTREQKEQMERRLESLRSVSESKDVLESNKQAVSQQLETLQQSLLELEAIQSRLNAADALNDESIGNLNDAQSAIS